MVLVVAFAIFICHHHHNNDRHLALVWKICVTKNKDDIYWCWAHEIWIMDSAFMAHILHIRLRKMKRNVKQQTDFRYKVYKRCRYFPSKAHSIWFCLTHNTHVTKTKTKTITFHLPQTNTSLNCYSLALNSKKQKCAKCTIEKYGNSNWNRCWYLS